MAQKLNQLTKIHIPIWCGDMQRDGTVCRKELIAWKPVNAFVLHNLFAIHSPGRGYRCKAVTHIPSGVGIGRFPIESVATEVITKLMESKINWNKELIEQFSEVDVATIRLIKYEVICRYRKQRSRGNSPVNSRMN